MEHKTHHDADVQLDHEVAACSEDCTARSILNNFLVSVNVDQKIAALEWGLKNPDSTLDEHAAACDCHSTAISPSGPANLLTELSKLLQDTANDIEVRRAAVKLLAYHLQRVHGKESYTRSLISQQHQPLIEAVAKLALGKSGDPVELNAVEQAFAMLDHATHVDGGVDSKEVACNLLLFKPYQHASQGQHAQNQTGFKNTSSQKLPDQQYTAAKATTSENEQPGDACEFMFIDGLLELMLDGRTRTTQVADCAFSLLHGLASQQHCKVVQHIVDVGFIPRLQSLAKKFWSVNGIACVDGGLETREERNLGARAAVALLWMAVGGGLLYRQRLFVLQLALHDVGRNVKDLMHAVIYNAINNILPATCEEAATAFNLQHRPLYTPAAHGIRNRSDNTPTAARWLLLVDTSNWVGALATCAIDNMQQDPLWESLKKLIISDSSKDSIGNALAQTGMDRYLKAMKDTAIDEMRQKHVGRMRSGFPQSAEALRLDNIDVLYAMEGGRPNYDMTKQCITDNLHQLSEQGILTEAEVLLWTSGAGTASEVDAQKLLRDSQSAEKIALHKLSSHLRFQLANFSFIKHASNKIKPYQAVTSSARGYSADCVIAMAAQEAQAVYGPNGINICILSRDSDYMQLMDNQSLHLLYITSRKKDAHSGEFDVNLTGGQRLGAYDGGGRLCTKGASLLRSQGLLSKGIQNEHASAPAFGMPPVNYGFKDAVHVLHTSSPIVPVSANHNTTDKQQQQQYASSFQAFHLFASHGLLHNWYEEDLLQFMSSFIDISPRVRVSYWVNKMLHNIDVAQPQLSCYPLGDRNELLGVVESDLMLVKNAGVAQGFGQRQGQGWGQGLGRGRGRGRGRG